MNWPPECPAVAPLLPSMPRRLHVSGYAGKDAEEREGQLMPPGRRQWAGLGGKEGAIWEDEGWRADLNGRETHKESRRQGLHLVKQQGVRTKSNTG